MEKGLALYTIESDSCLNGVYTEDVLDGETYREVARLKKKLKGDEICGIYDSLFFGKDNPHNKAELRVTGTLKKSGKYEYTFVWVNESTKKVFEGFGYKMNEKQIVVHYWMVKEPRLKEAKT
jgi:hypothetical protein